MSSNPVPRPAVSLAEDDEDESSQIRRLPSDLPSRLRRRKRATSERVVRQEALSRSTLPDLAPYRDTIPSPAPAPEAFRPTDLERTLRFARLVRDTLVPEQSTASGSQEFVGRNSSLGHKASAAAHTIQLLDMAIARRDAALLRAILKHLHDDQQRARVEVESRSAADVDELEEAAVARSTRHTILPPPPDPAANTGIGKTRR